MPWQEVKPMDQKLLFIADHLRRVTSFRELCDRYGISRKTGYKWVARYQALGFDGLVDQSRRPQGHPRQTPYPICKAILALRNSRRESLGAKKIRVLLQQRYPAGDIPSETTIYNILSKAGLISAPKRRKRVAPGQQPFSAVHHPNDVWSADFKGQFKTRDGTWCYPLTIMDHHTRYLLACQNLAGTYCQKTQDAFQALFQEHGLPWRIRTDNGVPFASRSPGGLSRLSKWWIRLGITPERIEPGKPQQNGRHERMHRTLKQASVIPSAQTPDLQQQAFDEFREQYNHDRPHESLDQQTPASVYHSSARCMPEVLPELEYPAHLRIRLVNHNGVIYHQGHRVYIAGLLKGEKVGVEEVAEDVWDVYFGPVKLGYFEKVQMRKAQNEYLSLKM